MKQSLLTLFVFVNCLGVLSAQHRKLALLVGIGQYADAPYSEQPLNAHQGLQLVQKTLISKGFSENNIQVLRNGNATKAGIQNAYEALLENTNQGDIVVFYFYGHGAQIKDDQPNEEADHLDEALAPANATYTSESEHRHMLRDDELGKWIKALRKKTGPSGQVLVLLDACHSGSGLRGGTKTAKPDRHQLAEDEDSFEALAPMVAFYSSMPHQSSYEKNVEPNLRCALLSWAFCKAMQEADSNSTYRSLFEQTGIHMATRSRAQSPQLEGAQDRLIFGGQVAPPIPYFKVVAALDDTECLLGAGLLNGLNPGDRLVFFPPETRDTARATPLGYGTVQENGINLLESSVILDKAVPEAQAARAWVFVAQKQFSGYGLALSLEVEDAGQHSQLTAELADMSAVRIVNGGEGDLLLSVKNDNMALTTAEGETIWSGKYGSKKTTGKLREALGDYLQAQFLRKLEFNGSTYQATFTAQIGANGSAVGRSGLTLRQQQDTVMLKVVNQSTVPIFYTILDIDARNQVKVLFPGEGWMAADFRLAPGAESPPLPVRFKEPGREVLKLIATPKPIDLRDAIATRGKNQKGRSFFENLFHNTYPENSQNRGPSGSYRGNEAGVETVVLEVER